MRETPLQDGTELDAKRGAEHILAFSTFADVDLVAQEAV